MEEKNITGKASELRKRAEEINAQSPENAKSLSLEETQQVLHELRVHQIELEMQNEELRTSQAELEASRMRYFDLYDLAPVGYCTISEQGLILEANLTAATLLGVPCGTLTRKPFSRFILNEDQDIYYLHRKQPFESGETQVVDLRMLKGDGTTFWVDLTITTTEDADGTPVCRIAISDISKRKRVEDVLLQATHRLAQATSKIAKGDAISLPMDSSIAEIEKINCTFNRMATELGETTSLLSGLLNSIPDIVFFKDKEGVYLGCNSAFARYVNKDIPDIIGSTDYDLFSKEISDFFRRQDRIMMDVGKPRHNEEWITYTDGAHILFDTLKAPLKDVDGHVIGLLGVSRDITERKRAEEALRESEDRFALAIKGTGAGLWDWDMVKDQVVYSMQWKKMIGYEVDEVENTFSGWKNLWHPDDCANIEKTLQDYLAGKTDQYEIIHRLRHKDGSWRWILTRGNIVKDAQGKPCRWVGTNIDVTERRQMEEALRTSKAKLELALMSSHMGVWQFNVVEKKRVFDDQVCRLLGLNPATFGGTTAELFAAVHPDDREKVQSALTQSIERNAPYAPEYRVVWPEGSIHHICARGKLIRDDSTGQALTLNGVIWDITERKKAEEKLKKVSERLSLAARAGGVGIWDYDPVRNTLVWDDQMFRLYGLTSNQFSGAYEAWQAGVHPEDRSQGDAEIKMALRGEKEFDTEFRVLWLDGSIHNIRALAVVQRDAAGKPLHMIGTNWDITDQKRAAGELCETNHQLEAATARAVQANAAKSDFLANMSHEIRTPMNGVIGMTGLLLDTELSDEQRKYAETVRASGESLLTIINDILDFSKIEAGKLALEMLEFDLCAILDDFAASLTLQVQKKGLEFICATAPDVPVHLCGDPGRLRQVLVNMVGNALKFTQTGEIAVRAGLISENDSEAVLRFSVRDTGIGIPADKKDSLFQKFTQVDSSTTRKYGGTGLGLAISKQIASLMGGEIGVESPAPSPSTSGGGAGSEFWFTARFAKQTVGQHDLSSPQTDIYGAHILVVDDNATNREILKAQLTAWGVRSEEVSDGLAAIQSLYKAQDAGDPFQLAILDMLMPGMDGVSLASAIKADPNLKDIYLLLLTSMGKQNDSTKMKEIGFSAFLTKPVRQSNLFDSLSAVLTGKNILQGQETQPVFTPESFSVNRKPVRILLAEDNVVNQNVAVGILKRLGLSVDVVVNGAEAVRALESVPYDLVLMDVQMPVMDGMEATRQIRDPHSTVLNHRIPVIAMTAGAIQGDREECLNAGMNDYVTKPVFPHNLAKVLGKWLPKDKAEGGNEKGDSELPSSTSDHQSSPIFNRAGIKALLMNDADLIRTVAKSFLENIPQQIAALKGYLGAGDASNTRRLAHSIKGASANVCGEALREVAAEMEKEAFDGDLAAVAGRMAELEEQFDALKRELKKEL